MTLQIVKAGFRIPPTDHHTSTNGLAYGSMAIDAANEKVAMILQVPKSGTISAVGFRTGTVATGATVDVRLETVDTTTGDPTGTLVGTNTNAALVITNTDDNVWFEVTLTAGASVTKGDFVAVVIVNPAVSFGNININRMSSTLGVFPYTDHFTASWSRSNAAPVTLLKYNDGSYEAVPGTFPYKNVTVATVSSSANPDEIGNIFQLPFPVRVTGFWYIGEIDGDTTFNLYDTDGTTVLLSMNVDANLRGVINTGPSYYYFASTATLAKDVDYRLTVAPGATIIEINSFEVASASVMDALPLGQKFRRTHRTDGGAWTDVATERCLIGLLCDAADDGVSASNIFSVQANTTLIVPPWKAVGVRR